MLSAAQLRALHSLFRQFAPQPPTAAHHSDCSFTPALERPNAEGDERASAFRASVARKDAFGDWPLSRAASSPSTSARDHRLAWASEMIGRDLGSFAALTSREAAALIDSLKRALGQEVRQPRSRRRPDRAQAHAYGTAGRRNSSTNEIRLVDAATMELIDGLVDQLGWTRDRLQSFLRSRTSPLRSGAIRTLPEANRVIWALKNMKCRAESFPRLPRGKTTTRQMKVRVAEESDKNEDSEQNPQSEACSSASC